MSTYSGDKWVRVAAADVHVWRALDSDGVVVATVPARLIDRLPPLVEARSEIARLRDAIGAHRDAMLSSYLIVDGSRYDEELWEVLDDGGDR